MLALRGSSVRARARTGARALLSKVSPGDDAFWDWSGRRALRDLATQLRARAALTQDAVASYRVVAETISHFNQHYVAGKGWNIPELTAGLAVLAALDPEPRLAPDTSTCADVTGGSLVLQLRYFAQHAHAVYRTSVAHAAHEACLEPGAIVDHRLAAAPLRPAHYLAVDHENSCIILSVRGTHEMVDFLTGASFAIEPFLDGHAHRGAAEAARFLAGRYGPEMASLQRQHPGYAVRVTGHSLGAAVGVLAVALMRAPGALEWDSPPEAVLFSTPPCATEPLARHCDAFAVNTVFGDDVVGRLSLTGLWDLQERMQRRKWRDLLARAAERDSGVPDTVVRSLRTLVDRVDTFAARAQHEARELADMRRPDAAAAATAAAAREARRALSGWVQLALRDRAAQRIARSLPAEDGTSRPAQRDWSWPWRGAGAGGDDADKGRWPAGAEKAARRAVAAAEEAMTTVEARARAQWDQRPTRALEASLSSRERELERWVVRAKQWYRPTPSVPVHWSAPSPVDRSEGGQEEEEEDRAVSDSTAEDTGSSLGPPDTAWRRWVTGPASPTGPGGSLVGRLTGFARPWWRDASAPDASVHDEGERGGDGSEGGVDSGAQPPRRRMLRNLHRPAFTQEPARQRRVFPPGTFKPGQRRVDGAALEQAAERVGAGPSGAAGQTVSSDRELLDLAISGSHRLMQPGVTLSLLDAERWPPEVCDAPDSAPRDELLAAGEGSAALGGVRGGLLRVSPSHFDRVVVSPAMLTDHSCRRLKRALNSLLAPEWRGPPSPRPALSNSRACREWGESSVSEDSAGSGEEEEEEEKEEGRHSARMHPPSSLLPGGRGSGRHSAEDVSRHDLPRRPDLYSAPVLAFVGRGEYDSR